VKRDGAVCQAQTWTRSERKATEAARGGVVALQSVMRSTKVLSEGGRTLAQIKPARKEVWGEGESQKILGWQGATQ